MPTFLLEHQHDAADCGVAVAAWRGWTGTPRPLVALRGCAGGDHRGWFVVEAPDGETALRRLPPWVAARSGVVAVEPA